MRVYARIDLDAIRNNLKQNMDHVGKDVKVMAVVKTDAYGHGAVPIAKALNEDGAYGFAVATVEEAMELREAGLQNPILVLGHVFFRDLPEAFTNHILITVDTLVDAKRISEIAVAMKTTASIHIKVDTGMGRLGFQPTEESKREILEISRLPNVELDGIFTHFAKADAADKTSMEKQESVFLQFIKELEEMGLHFPIRHMCNSAATMEKKDGFLDMVRIGATLYGFNPSDEVSNQYIKPQPVLSLISHVSHIKEVGPGFTVSYGSTYVTTEEHTVIATVPVGYGDGYPRSLSNKGFVLIGGTRCPILGRVTMDQCMVDVTHLPKVAIGDEVVLLGKQGEEEITLDELGTLSSRFDYEFVCDLNQRVPRLYKK
jgi:alanine racemase